MKAHELIADKKNWCKGSYHVKRRRWYFGRFAFGPTTEQYCMMGAILKANEQDPSLGYTVELRGLFNAVDGLLSTHVNVPDGWIISAMGWNDEKERTHEEVLAFLRKFDL